MMSGWFKWGIRFWLCAWWSGAHGQSDFYAPESVQEIRIEFTQSNWRYILDSLFQHYGEDARLDGSVSINGQLYQHAGIRYKGFSSYDASQAKNPFNIDLNSGYSNQNHEGFYKLKLSNVIHDPSFVREVLAYEMARNYMPSPQANFAMVYVNDTLMGLYSNVEAVDKHFIGRHFSSDDNPFFKGSPETLSYPFGQNANLAYTHGDTWEDYIPYYKMESDEGWEDLFELIYILNNDTSQLASILNIDRALWMHAFNYSMVNLDSYIGYAQNYYLYKDDQGCFNPILWDLNMSFGSFRQSDGTMINLTIDKIKVLNPLQHLYNMAYSPRPMMKNLFANHTYRLMYLAHLRTIMDEQFRSGAYYTRAIELQTAIDTFVQTDSNKFYTYADFIANADSTTGPSSDLYPGLRDLMEARLAYLDTFPGMQGAPILQNGGINPLRPRKNQYCRIQCKVSDADEVKLFYRQSTESRFLELPMYDDGLHGDSLSGDSIFGAEFFQEGDALQYYFYAQNDSAGRFLPERAQYEYFTAWPEPAASSVMINELKLKANASQWDQDDEAEPWVELYNRSSEILQLDGLVLMNDADTLLTFSDSVLQSNAYVIIWADGDLTQSGLHCKAIDVNYGTIRLISASGFVIDSLIFGEQSQDLSYGSYPNGSSMRVILTPTFSTKNILAGNQDSNSQIFPNPASDQLYIRFNDAMEGDYIEIFNQQLQLVYSESLSRATEYPSETLLTLNVGFWTEGLYVLRLSQQNATSTHKFMIIR